MSRQSQVKNLLGSPSHGRKFLVGARVAWSMGGDPWVALVAPLKDGEPLDTIERSIMMMIYLCKVNNTGKHAFEDVV
jgi:hypothetical protein